ncbi:DUF523 domain-containing protein [Roseateles sp. DAIF2]|uniref:DUF523 domain-containing protein n=1 Tax=Roseateles sp. DAIF2 TaxID=2714952 RepID=UPI0018A26453|nr:DUF523 domain-containing protein [Roseateles sp. DAIF2]QPF74799.1 DUF523 domain-containing protein [Roseateles sp. DAIF2]
MSATPRQEPLLISACLLGSPVRYHGRGAACGHALLAQWRGEGRLVPICPEVAGGLPTPRPPAEIEPGQGGAAVLRRAARVIDASGADVSAAFVGGAELALALARERGIRVAVLKEDSPSCGSERIYDGRFAGARVAGEGVSAALLRAAGLLVFSEHQLEQAAAALARFEAAG